jgi:tetratricopeptide (TPR) repeat protein
MDKELILSIKRRLDSLRRDPHRKVQAQLADGYRHVGLVEDAIETCEQGLKVHPSYLLCREVLGKILLRLGRLAEAKEQLEHVQEFVQNDTDLNRAMAKLYMQANDLDAARPLVEYVVDRDPFDFEIRALLSTLDGLDEIDDDEITEDNDDTPEGVDIFDTKSRRLVFDLESIVTGKDEELPSAEDVIAATDLILDDIENFEEEIDSQANSIMSYFLASQKPTELGKRPRKARRKSTLDIGDFGQTQLKGAATTAQLHMEIALMEEAINLAVQIHNEQSDPMIGELAERLKAALHKKENDLNSLEDEQLFVGF